jgi:hypothetical protein
MGVFSRRLIFAWQVQRAFLAAAAEQRRNSDERDKGSQ